MYILLTHPTNSISYFLALTTTVYNFGENSNTDVKYGIVPATQDENCFEVPICPDLLVAAFGAIGAALTLALYMALTMLPRRRRRDLRAAEGAQETILDIPPPSISVLLSDILFSGRQRS